MTSTLCAATFSNSYIQWCLRYVMLRFVAGLLKLYGRFSWHCTQERACQRFLNSGFSILKGPSHQKRMTWNWYFEIVLVRPSAAKSLFNVLLQFSEDAKITLINKSFGLCFHWGSQTFIWTTRVGDICLLPNALLWKGILNTSKHIAVLSFYC